MSIMLSAKLGSGIIERDIVSIPFTKSNQHLHVFSVAIAVLGKGSSIPI